MRYVGKLASCCQSFIIYVTVYSYYVFKNLVSGCGLESRSDFYIGAVPNPTFERVGEFKYLGTILTNQNSIAEEIKNRLRSENAWYHSMQNLLSSRLLYDNLKIKI